MQEKQLPLALEPPLYFNPDDLVIGKANEAAFRLLQEWPHWRVPITVLVGAAGSGKSHMASCWAAMSGAQSRDPAEIDTILQELGANSCVGSPLLIEDICPGAFCETALFHLLNSLMQARLENPSTALVLTSRLHPAAWEIKLADLASRLKMVQLAQIFPPDDALLLAVMTKLFADRQLLVEPQLMRYCLSRMERSLEAVTRFVAILDRLALERKSKITRSLSLQALAQL